MRSRQYSLPGDGWRVADGWHCRSIWGPLVIASLPCIKHNGQQERIYIQNCTRIGLGVCNENVLLFSGPCLNKRSTTSSSGKTRRACLRARCIKTPLMTPTAAKPKTPLKRMVSRLKPGLRSSCTSRATGTQVPRVIWNIVSIPGSGQGPADGAAIVPQVATFARKLMIVDRCY